MIIKSLLALIPIALVLASDNPNKFAPFGTANGDTLLGVSDDGSSNPVIFDFPFFEVRRPDLYVNVNGLVTFDGPVGLYTPFNTCSLSFGAIAAYWSDVDTRPNGGGNIFYRSTTDSALLAYWSSQTPDQGFHGVRMFIITWDNVGYYYQHYDKRVSFQALLITDGTNSWVFLNFGTLQWTTGDASEGVNGLGGSAAVVGFTAGDGTRCSQTAASGTAGVLGTTNSVTLVSGRILQQCGNGIVEGTEQCDGGSCCTSTCSFDNSTACFCARQNLNGGQMGYYCNANGGFYQCLGGAYASQSKQMTCAQGTSCGCNFGVECSCNQRRSPCVSPSANNACPSP